MILAAGKGTRLRPLTNNLPKPLVPFYGVPLLGYALQNFSSFVGMKNIAVNCHHAKEAFQDFLRSHKNFDFHLSEEAKLLGSGGGIAKIRSWVGEKNHLLVQSGDVVAPFDLQALAKKHFENKNIATIYTVSAQPGETAITITGGLLKSLQHKASAKHTFANCYILSPEFLSNMTAEPSSVIETFQSFLAKEGVPIEAIDHQGYWMNLNRVEDYKRELKEFLQNPEIRKILNIKSVHDLFAVEDYTFPSEYTKKLYMQSGCISLDEFV